MMQRDQQPRSGFTLIELIVSIAIVVVLMVGVAQVFQYTGQAVGATQQMSEAVRNDRAIQSTMGAEIPQIAGDSPILMIRGTAGLMFRNRADRDSDPTPNDPSTWEQRTNDTGAGSISFPASPNDRSHRVDRLAFMARGLFPRQTGNDGVFVAPQTSREAFVWYGHLCLPHTNGNFYLSGATSGMKTNPGAGTTPAENPQNYYASQWALGRVGHLLIQPTGATLVNAGTIGIGTISQQFIRRDPARNTDPIYLGPLSINSSAADGADVQDCRYDLAGTTISGFATVMRNSIGAPWQSGVTYQASQRVTHNGFTYVSQSLHTSSGATVPNPISPPGVWAIDWSITDWWSDIFMTARYECNPFVIKPLDSKAYSQQAPVFAQGCTQFIVEFAGDFLRQDTDPASATYGCVLDSFDNPNDPPPGLQHTDGEVDFIVSWDDVNLNGWIDAAERPSIKRTTRWYGLPRDINGDGEVLGYREGQRFAHQLVDVVPLRDVAMTIHTAANFGAPFSGLAFSSNSLTFYDPTNGVNSYIGAPFERFLFQSAPPNSLLPYRDAYMDLKNDPNNLAGLKQGEVYQCAWGPFDTVRPKMLRIIMTLDDPNSRLAEGQTFEYVYKLP